jgi:hypothetical protein
MYFSRVKKRPSSFVCVWLPSPIEPMASLREDSTPPYVATGEVSRPPEPRRHIHLGARWV